MTSVSTPAIDPPLIDWGVFETDQLDELRSFFVANGFAILRGLWSADEVAQFDADCTRAQRAVAAGELPDRYGNRDKMNLGGFHDSSVPTHIYHVTELSETLAAAVVHPHVVDSIATWLGDSQMLGADGLFGVVFQDARRDASSGYSRFGWHSDWQSGPHDPRWPGVVSTIHLDATSPSNGFLRVVPGSHLWATPAPYDNANGVAVPEGSRPTGGHTDTPPPFPMPTLFDKVPGEVPLYCERGDLLFHDSYVWHAAARGTDDASARRHVRSVWRTKVDEVDPDAKNVIFPIAL